MTFRSIRRVALISSISIASGLACAITEPGVDQTQSTQALSIATPDQIWESAASGQNDELSSLLNPSLWTHADSDIYESIELLNLNLEKRETTRQEKLDEARTLFDEHVAKYKETNSRVELSNALSLATRIQNRLGDIHCSTFNATGIEPRNNLQYGRDLFHATALRQRRDSRVAQEKI